MPYGPQPCIDKPRRVDFDVAIIKLKANKSSSEDNLTDQK